MKMIRIIFRIIKREDYDYDYYEGRLWLFSLQLLREKITIFFIVIMREDYDYSLTFMSPPQLAAQETRPSEKQGFNLKLCLLRQTLQELQLQ